MCSILIDAAIVSTDRLAWAKLVPLLPVAGSKRGRPPKPHRLVMEGMPWILRTGAASLVWLA